MVEGLSSLSAPACLPDYSTQYCDLLLCNSGDKGGLGPASVLMRRGICEAASAAARFQHFQHFI